MSPAGRGSSAPWVVIMIVSWPALGEGVGTDTSLRPRKGHPWWSLFSNPVHQHEKNKIWIVTDAASSAPAFQSRCQSRNKSVGLWCLASTSLNWTQITAFFETFDFKVCRLKFRFYAKPFNLFVYLSQLIKNINKSLRRRQNSNANNMFTV